MFLTLRPNLPMCAFLENVLLLTKLVYGVKFDIDPLLLGDKPLPFVDTWKHLGHTLTTDESPSHDMLLRCRELVGKLHGLRQEFPEQHPEVMMKLINIYLLSLYGGALWDIYSTEANKLSATWHRIIKQEFKLPLATHRYLLNSVSQCVHLRLKVVKQFLNFQQKISNSANPNIALLHRLQCSDMRSVYGTNIRNICRDAGVQSINQVDVSSMLVNPVPAGEEWRIPLLQDLRESVKQNPGFMDTEDIKLMMFNICVN